MFLDFHPLYHREVKKALLEPYPRIFLVTRGMSHLNNGRISSQVPQATRTVTIFLLLFTVCHIARVDSRVHVCVRTHTNTDSIHVRLCTARRTSQPIAVVTVVSFDDSVH